jgi:outer membrane protein assembly factor BamB
MLRFSFLFLLLVLSKPAFPQERYVALITNPEIGTNGNAQNLLEVVDSINQIPNVFHVVVLGNITANGLFDEFIWAQEILDGLAAPYFVVGGEKDYLLSEGRGSEISLLWGDDKYFYSNGRFGIACLNTIIPEYPDKKYIETESLDWFAEQTTTNKSSRILTFSYYPISSSENGSKFFEKTRNFKKFSFVCKKDKSTKDKSIIEGFYLNRKDGWGYSLIKIKSDSLFIENILTENTKKREVAKFIFTPVTFDKIVGNDSKGKNPNVFWEKNYNKTTITKSIYSNGKIYQGFKNGSVECMDKLGNEKWDYQTNGRIYSSPIIENDLLVVATNEGDLLTLNANTGSLVQVIGIGETITSEICVVDIKEDGGTTKAVVVGTENGYLYSYNLYTLEPIWINQSANDGISNRIISSIACADNKVLFQDFNGILYCVSAVNGLLLWYWKPPVKNSNPFFNTDLFGSLL